MPKNKRKGAKDFAQKQTLNPPGGGKKPVPGYTEEQQAPREVGQFTGQGSPGLQKK